LDVIDKQEAQLMLRKLHDAIRREDKYQQLVGRRILCGGSRYISRPWGRTALPLLSVLRPQIFYIHPNDRLFFPIEFRSHKRGIRKPQC